MLGPFATASRLTPIHQVSLAVLSRATYASMSTTTTTRDRGDRYGPMNGPNKLIYLSIYIYNTLLDYGERSKMMKLVAGTCGNSAGS